MRVGWKSQRLFWIQLRWVRLAQLFLPLQQACQRVLHKKLLLAPSWEVKTRQKPKALLKVHPLRWMRKFSVKIPTLITSLRESMKTSQSWIPMVLAGSLGSWQAGRLLWWPSRSRGELVAADEEERERLMSRHSTIQRIEHDCQGGRSCGEVGYERGNMGRWVPLAGRGRV